MSYVGSKVNVLLMQDRGYSSGSYAPYPNWYGTKIPVEVIGDYPNFYVCKVLPHVNTKSFSMGESGEYRVTIDKFDIATNIFKWEKVK